MLQCQFSKILFFTPETNQKYLLEKYRVVRQWRIVRKPPETGRRGFRQVSSKKSKSLVFPDLLWHGIQLMYIAENASDFCYFTETCRKPPRPVSGGFRRFPEVDGLHGICSKISDFGRILLTGKVSWLWNSFEIFSGIPSSKIKRYRTSHRYWANFLT